jgi:prophage maintenance system killer protein
MNIVNIEMINEYNKLSIIEKLEKLLGEYKNSAKLSSVLDVSRTSLVRWMDNPESINDRHVLDINVLYCDTFVTPVLTKTPIPDALFLPDDYQPKLTNLHFKSMTFGTYEIEDMNADSGIFEKIISEESLPRGIDKKTFMAMYNTWISMTQLMESIKKRETISISGTFIRNLHSQFMRGVRPDAGQYAKKIRVMGKLQGIDTTLPEDIASEISYWCTKYEEPNDLMDIATAHSHFIRIHPFGDGNGRVGRALLTIQLVQMGLKPAALRKDNQAVYYSTLAWAMRHGQNKPLAHLLRYAQKH